MSEIDIIKQALEREAETRAEKLACVYSDGRVQEMNGHELTKIQINSFLDGRNSLHQDILELVEALEVTMGTCSTEDYIKAEDAIAKFKKRIGVI